MKKILIILAIIVSAVLFKLPSIHKAMSFKADKETLNIIPVEHSLGAASEFVVITDEIVLFKKFLVEVPIDLDVTENSSESVILKSEEEEKRMVTFNFTPVDKVADEKLFTYEFMTKLLNTTYEVSPDKPTLFNPFAHSKLLTLKKVSGFGATGPILSFNEDGKKGFIFSGEEKNLVTNAYVYLEEGLIEVSFVGLSEKERDFVLVTLKKDN